MKVYSIQNLRYYLAILVVIYHICMFPEVNIYQVEILKYAVDVFFVISGFAITLSIHKTTNNFLFKRIKTIYPKYWMYLSIIIIIKYIGLNFGYVDSIDNILISYLLLPVLDNNGNLIRPELIVGWTLMYEMTFYILITIVILFTKKKKK